MNITFLRTAEHLDPGLSMESQILETWAIHNRINLYLLTAVPAAAMSSVSASKGRNVAEQFAHMHNVRLMWLKSGIPELLAADDTLVKQEGGTHEQLSEALERSGAAISELLSRSLASGGRVRGFKPHTLAFLGYMISHESHHRGQIVLTLKQAGYAVDKKVAYGLWEWGRR